MDVGACLHRCRVHHLQCGVSPEPQKGVMYGHKKGSCMDRITGALLCSLFSTGVYYGIISLFPSVPPEAAVAVGSLVGFLGVDECKDLLMKKLKKLLDIEDKE